MSQNMPCVIDCSIALAWYFADEAHPYADAVLDGLSQSGAVVPALWPLELANALVMGERRGRSTAAQATIWLGMLEALPIRVDDETNVHAWSTTLHLARAHGLTSYDASYLELALRLGVPMATFGGALKAAAVGVGVPLFQAPAP